MAGFRRESEMTPFVKKWMRSQGLLVREEFSTPWGICDLAGVKLVRRRAKLRIDYGQRTQLSSISSTALLMHIADQRDKRQTTLAELEGVFSSSMSKSELGRELDRLMKGRFVETPRVNVFQKLNGWMPLHERIVAVELKLSRAAEVLAQARNHTDFATEVYVALPAEAAKRLSQRFDNSEKAGTDVGIIAVSREGCRVVRPSPRIDETEVPALQAHLVDRFWPLWLKDNSA